MGPLGVRQVVTFELDREWTQQANSLSAGRPRGRATGIRLNCLVPARAAKS
jgi:hypothetical protein